MMLESRGSDAAIVGLGVVGPYPFVQAQTNNLQLTADAIVAAAADASVGRIDIDGLAVNAGGRTGPDYDQLASYLGLELRACVQSLPHGRFMSTVLHEAAMLVDNRDADLVACVWGQGLAPHHGPQAGHGDPEEELRPGGGAHSERPEVGLTRAIGTAAMTTRLYCETYEIDPLRLYDVVSASRENARLYPDALRPSPMSFEEYKSSPYMVDPLREADWLASAAGAVCVLVGRGSEAKRGDRSVRIAGYVPLPGGREEFVWARPGLGMAQQSVSHRPKPDQRIFDESGVPPQDVSLFMTHDACSVLVWLALERYGYSEPGEGADFVTELGIGVGGDFPINTHGGSLSAGQLGGWLNIAEGVTQLRDEAGPRQVKDAKAVHYGSCSGDTIMLTRM